MYNPLLPSLRELEADDLRRKLEESRMAEQVARMQLFEVKTTSGPQSPQSTTSTSPPAAVTSVSQTMYSSHSSRLCTMLPLSIYIIL